MDMIAAFSTGIVLAYPYYPGYALPPNFEAVINRMATAMEARFSFSQGMAELSLLEIEDFWREFVETDEEATAWNRIGDVEKDAVVAVSRYSAQATGPEFIDLGALVRNASVWLRNDRRRFDAFNAEFESKYGHLSE